MSVFTKAAGRFLGGSRPTRTAIEERAGELVAAELERLRAATTEAAARAVAQATAKRIYRDERRHLVRTTLEATRGNVKRTARLTSVPETTVRSWKREWSL